MSEPEPVGTLAEEAAKLFAAVQAWAGRPDVGARPEPEDEPPVDAPGENGHASANASAAHACDHTGQVGAQCRWCPVCQLVRLARSTSPDVRTHLSSAALSLALAVQSLLEEPAATASRAAPVEKIELAEE